MNQWESTDQELKQSKRKQDHLFPNTQELQRRVTFNNEISRHLVMDKLTDGITVSTTFKETMKERS